MKSDRERALEDFDLEEEMEDSWVTCPDCGGSGRSMEGWDCPVCDGTGEIDK